VKNKQIDESLVSVIDFGSSKIRVAIAEIDENNNMSLIGKGESESKGGIRSGVIVNIESVVGSIVEAVERAEMQAGREINGVFAGVSGGSIESFNSKGVVAIAGADKEIRETDIDRVIEAARAVAIPMDRQELHIIPQWFTVDGQEWVKNPKGMVGTRLESQIHIITTPISSVQNIKKCLDRAGLEIYDIVLQNICSSKAVLTEEEKEVGVLLLDIGSETINASVYYNKSPIYNAIYPIGGYLISNDIAAGLKLPLTIADKFKLGFGVTSFDSVEPHETVQIPSISGRIPKIIERSMLVQIIKPRVEEMFGQIKMDLEKSGVSDKISGGVIITGGTAGLKGIEDVAVEVFEVSSSIGCGKYIDGLWDQINTPEYSVVNGLLRWGKEKISTNINQTRSKKKDGTGIFTRLVDFIDKFF